MNKITVHFNGCDPAPSGGYNIMYRVQGTDDEYTNAGNFFVSPAVFYDTVNPAGTCYEGFITSVCGGVFGNPVNWEGCSESGSDPRILAFSVIEGDPNINVHLNAPIDVPITINSVFVNGYNGGSCMGAIDQHMHSTNESILAGSIDYTGADFSTGPWVMITSHLFYNVVLSWPGNSNVTVNDGDVLVMGSYTVSISITGC